MALTVARGSSEPTVSSGVSLFLREVLGGIGLGLVVSMIMHHMLLRVREYVNQLLVTLAGVALGYGLAEHIDVSGPIAIVVAGLVVGNFTLRRLSEARKKPLATFWSGLDETLDSLLFVLIGLSVVVVHPVSWSRFGVGSALAILVCLIARALSVYLPISGLVRIRKLDADRWALTRLLTWSGLRGGLALALALSIPDSPEKATIVNLTYAVVAFSILVQGSTIGRLFGPELLKGLVKPSPGRHVS